MSRILVIFSILLLSGCAAPTLKMVNHVGAITYEGNAEYSSKQTEQGLFVVAFRSVHRFLPDTQKDYQECSDVLNTVAKNYKPVLWNEVTVAAHEYNGVTGTANTTCSFTFKEVI
ncbi:MULTISPECIES: hypothetical protein [unclassified Shewanella]|uniref:hypothetical protein n=1 Tax=unclassified Shewanella TaxID=196818 RepID=UPI000C830F6D|nr:MULTISPECIES: hypothetical protein [unclassified Shewanella]MDO6679393.1 hypothetical protein [Shewanella sp. 4_MG-2023]PMG51486.1 hypothetical protein BCU91_16500 [Shewanella sp. 10N.286.52.B9]